jgi:lipopolysaccharide/colanic/teichoic acid biosynthesis glycosyltransferase
VLALPWILLGALLVKRASPGQPFYAQDREGLERRPIRVWKIRTMEMDADRRLGAFLAENPDLESEWNASMKLARDPRIIPRIGEWLRRTSIDELPQLWSVVRGEMSLVGPRPFPRYHLDRFPEEFRAFRAKVRPGLTGLWQVVARSDGTLEDQRRLDTYYIRNWSIWLDLHIIARTVMAILSRRGAR